MTNVFRWFVRQLLRVVTWLVVAAILIDSGCYGELTIAPWQFLSINVGRQAAKYFGEVSWLWPVVEVRCITALSTATDASESIQSLFPLRIQGLPAMMGAYLIWVTFICVAFLLQPSPSVSWWRSWPRRVSIAVQSRLNGSSQRCNQPSSLCDVWMLASALYPFLLRLVTAHQEHRFLLPILPAVHFALAQVLSRARSAAAMRHRSLLRWASIMLIACMSLHLLLGIYLLQFHQVSDRLSAGCGRPSERCHRVTQAGAEAAAHRVARVIDGYPRRLEEVTVLVAAPCFSFPGYAFLLPSRTVPVRVRHLDPCHLAPW